MKGFNVCFVFGEGHHATKMNIKSHGVLWPKYSILVTVEAT